MKIGSPYLETKNAVKFNKVNNREKGKPESVHQPQLHCGEVLLIPSPSPEELMEGAEKNQTRCYLADLMRLQFADIWGLSLMMN